jgi:uncharacterized membrane protein YhfC
MFGLGSTVFFVFSLLLEYLYLKNQKDSVFFFWFQKPKKYIEFCGFLTLVGIPLPEKQKHSMFFLAFEARKR